VFEKKKLFIGFVIMSLLAGSISIAPATAQDWDMFHGNLDHTGYVDEASDFTPETWLYKATGAIKSSLAISDKTLYFGSTNGTMYALNLDDGTRVWTYNTGGSILSSPIVNGDNVYFGSMDNYFYALNKKNGDSVWKYKTGNGIESSPAIDNGVIYFGANDNRLYALNANDGSKRWEFATGNAVKSSPAVYGGNVYFGSDDGKIYALTINGAKVWEFDTGNAVQSSPAVKDNVLYVGTNNGMLYAMNTGDGSVKWSYNFKDAVKSSPVLDSNDNNLFVGADNGNITCLDMRDGKLKWSVNVGNVEATPSLMGDYVVVTSTSGTVYVLNKFSGKEEWSYSPGYYLFNTPLTSSAVYGDDIYVSSNDGYIYALDNEKKAGPTSEYLYYIVGIVAGIIVILIAIKVISGRRNKKNQ
jgi:outer membrane protein assembly factor BamB